jgi:DNA-binding LacI/PurR family transcriptional regulator
MRRPKKTPHRKTLRDVAMLAGVSTATASHALNNTRAVGNITRKRVEAAATELGYRANVLARSLKTGSSKLIGCIVANLANPLIASAVEGLQAALRERGYGLLVYRAGIGGEEVSRGVDFASSYNAAGLFVIHPDVTVSRALSRWSESNRHLVLGVHPHAELDVDQIVMAEEEAGFRATSYLISFGHRRIAVLTRSLRIGVYASILAGYKAALSKSRIAFDKSLVGSREQSAEHGEAELGQRETNRLLKLKPPPTAIICAHNQIAVGALRALRARDVDIPSEMSLIAFDQVDWMTATYPTITSIGIEGLTLGRAAAQLLMRRLEGWDGDPVTTELSLQLTERESVSWRPDVE